MKSILRLCFAVIVVVILESVDAATPKVIWQDSVGGPYSDNINSVEVGPDENPVLASAVMFHLEAPPGGKGRRNQKYRTVLRKYDPAGAKLWELKSSGEGSLEPVSMAIDSRNQIYLSCKHIGNVKIGGKLLNGSADSRGFLAKLSPDGSVIWLRDYPAGSIRIGPEGSCILAHIRRPKTKEGKVQLSRELFLEFIDDAGETEVSRIIASSVQMYGCALAVNKRGEILLSAVSQQDVHVAGEHFERRGGVDILLVKTSPKGVVEWARQIGNHADEAVRGIAWRSDGDFYLAGKARYLSLGSKRFFSKGRQDGFVGRFGPGGECRWIRRMGGDSWDGCSAIAVGSEDEVYCVGWMRSDESVDLNTANRPFSRSSNGFVTRLNGEGKSVWTKSVSSLGWDGCHSAVLTPDGILYVGGSWGAMHHALEASSSQISLSTEAGTMRTHTALYGKGMEQYRPISRQKSVLRTPPSTSDIFLLAFGLRGQAVVRRSPSQQAEGVPNHDEVGEPHVGGADTGADGSKNGKQDRGEVANESPKKIPPDRTRRSLRNIDRNGDDLDY